jgi:AraC-like DNA-binding protein
MTKSATVGFTDPFAFQAALRAAEVQLCVTGKGDYRAELTQIDLNRLWMQRAREDLPRIYHVAISPKRAVIAFLADANQAVSHYCGMEMLPANIVVHGLGSTSHHRTGSSCHWGAMSLTHDDLAAAGYALAGRDLTAPSHLHLARPSPALLSRLLNLHAAAEQLAKTGPNILAHPEVARALEKTLVHAMIMCLTESTSVEMRTGGRHHAAVITRFEELLEARLHEPLYLADICEATGAAERTLRACCNEHLGVGPVRYLWLRRMHLAHRALVLAHPKTETVTEIATGHGFWELGRFSVEYRALFGEAPSASLHRPPQDLGTYQNRPFDIGIV